MIMITICGNFELIQVKLLDCYSFYLLLYISVWLMLYIDVGVLPIKRFSGYNIAVEGFT